MITLTQSKVLNKYTKSFTWETDEGDITYSLYIKPIIGGSLTNPYYQVISVTSADADVDGTTWTYEINEAQLRNMYGCSVPYQWWVSGVATSSVGRFYWKPYVSENEWSVDPVKTESYKRTIIITGTYTGFIDKITVNNIEAEFLSGIWRLQVDLENGENLIYIKAYDKWGCIGEHTPIKVNCYISSGTIQNIQTASDRIGIYTGNFRYKGEDNYTFAKYKQQSLVYRGDPTRTGLINGLSNELRVPIYSAITIGKKPGAYTYDILYLKVDDTYIYVSTNKMLYKEHFVVSDTLCFGLSKTPTGFDTTVLINGKKTEKYEIKDRIIKFNRNAIGSTCHITYSYCELIEKDQTLLQIIKDLNGIEHLDCYFSDTVNKTWNGKSLIPLQWTNENIIFYSDIQVYPAGTAETQKRFSDMQETVLEYDMNPINPTLSYIWMGKESNGIAEELKKRRGYGWSELLLGVSYWTLQQYQSMSSLPQIMDAIYRRYGSYTPPVAELLEITDFTGITLFKGGVVYGLEVTL